MDDERVFYFSPTDLSLGYYLEKTEKAMERYRTTPPCELEDILEMFHINRMFANNCRLTNWSDEKFAKLKLEAEGYNATIAQFLTKLPKSKILTDFPDLPWEYKQSFWDTINQYRIFNIIPLEVVIKLVDGKIANLKQLLHCERIVDKYKSWIREFLLKDNKAAVLLIEEYVANRDFGFNRKIFLPSVLSLKDKENIINNYLDGTEPNLNYVRLICQIKNDHNKIVLSTTTRVKAGRLAKKLNNELLRSDKSCVVSYKTQISFSNDDNIPLIGCSFDDNGLKLTYSFKYIEKCDMLQLFYNCISLFGWMNQHFLLDLISKRNEYNKLEMIIPDHGRNAYPSFSDFRLKNDLAYGQLEAYNIILKKLGTSFEQVMKNFYEVWLKDRYDYCGFSLNFPNKDNNYLSKCLIVFPVLESVVKQYNCFVEYDKIDLDFIQFSDSDKMTNVKSLLTNKYYELKKSAEEINSILYCMFNHDSLLQYIDPFKEKYDVNFMDLVCKEEVNYNKYEAFQKNKIDFLIKHHIIVKEDNGRLRLANDEYEDILTSLWNYKACNYWHYNKEGRAVLDDMFEKGWLEKSEYLLTTEERRYFSFYLDNSEFTNGFAYRNLYSHGKTPPSSQDSTHQLAYYTLLRLLYILFVKIEDDLQCACQALLEVKQ